MITLLTDFGLEDYFVPAVKGVILTLQPTAKIVDLTHHIPAQNIRAAAFTIGSCYQNFPAGSIHLAVVDPGVGSARRAIIVEAGMPLFVGPDNGLFSFVYAREETVRVFHASRQEYFCHPISPTFHGRDVFAPLAAWLEKGLAQEDLGEQIDDYMKFNLPLPPHINEHVEGEIIHIDHFGNCITNLTASDLQLERVTGSTYLRIGEREVRQFGSHFAQLPDVKELFAYLGSAGFWEIAMWQDSAAAKLQIDCETVVRLRH